MGSIGVFLLEVGHTVEQVGKSSQQRCLPSERTPGDCGVAHDATVGRDIVGYARLSADGNAVANLDMACHANLPCKHAMVTDVRGAGNANLGGHDGITPDCGVVRYLNKVVKLCAVANTGASHGRTVYGCVCANLDIVGNLDVTQLWNLMIRPVGQRGKSKSVSTDYHSCMNDAVAANVDVMIDLRTGIYYRAVANRSVMAYVSLRVYLDTLAEAYALTNISESPDICIFGDLNTFGDKDRLLYTDRLRVNHIIGNGHQLRQSCIRICYAD